MNKPQFPNLAKYYCTLEQAPTRNVGSCSPFGSSSVVPNSGPSFNLQSNSNSTHPNQQSNESSNNNDMASTNKNIVPKPEAFSDKPEPTSAFKSSHTSAFQPVQNGCGFLAPKLPSGKADNGEADADQAPPRGSYQQVQVHHHHHHHYHHHVHKVRQNLPREDHDDLSLKNMAAAAPQCGSSNMFGEAFDSHAGNYSVNESASGSNHGSNGQNGSSPALNAGMTNVERDNGVAGNSEDDGIRIWNSGIGMDESRVSQREAALTKFRQKRKERCFEKRVTHFSLIVLTWNHRHILVITMLCPCFLNEVLCLSLLHCFDMTPENKTIMPLCFVFSGSIPQQEKVGRTEASDTGTICSTDSV